LILETAKDSKMNNQLLNTLVNDLCIIAGSYRGAADLEGLSLRPVLKHFARPDESKLPEGQGEDILAFLKIEIAEWNREITLRGIKISDTQCRELWGSLLNLDAADIPSRVRRLRTIQAIGLKRCGWQNWRKNVEPVFLQPLAADLIDQYPTRCEGLQAA
jgi:hypothetical protein